MWRKDLFDQIRQFSGESAHFSDSASCETQTLVSVGCEEDGGPGGVFGVCRARPPDEWSVLIYPRLAACCLPYPITTALET